MNQILVSATSGSVSHNIVGRCIMMAFLIRAALVGMLQGFLCTVA
ncbi:MAG TPA: hypothetical protein VEI52_05895 [Terriglobales bacterium]|nr:hypothetical protein [Terriglobales bacterium]